MNIHKIILVSIILNAFLSIWCIAQSYEFMTYNIRYDNKRDTINNWEDRKLEMTKLLNYYHPDVFGIQEGLNHQLNYIASQLQQYKYVGVGRNDGKNQGEYCAIFYNQKRLDLLEASTFWLSENPDSIYKAWDAAFERICTYALLKDLKTEEKFWVFNAHFDHIGKKARKNSAALILRKIKEINENEIPLVLMGDFNALPEDEPIVIFSSQFQDGQAYTRKPFYGPPGTFNAFEKDGIANRRIDYIFCSGFDFISYRHIDDRRDNNKHISDHFPVLAKVELISDRKAHRDW